MSWCGADAKMLASMNLLGDIHSVPLALPTIVAMWGVRYGTTDGQPRIC